jgi:ATP-dependent protease ClpP protease subunit
MPHVINLEGIIGDWDADIDFIRGELRRADGENVVVNIASPGGLISEGLNIYNALKNYSGRVDTHLVGVVASMATYIAMVGENRTAEKNAVFMIHNGRGMAVGDHIEMFKFGSHLKSLSSIVAKEYSEKSGIPLDDMIKAMNRTTYYYGDEIKEAGFVHEMVGDAEPEGREDAVAFAELMCQECQSKMNKPERVKKDLTALSVMMDDFEKKPSNNEQKPIIKDSEEIMNKKELKEKHPELYDEIVVIGQGEGIQFGSDVERKRVKMLTEMRTKFPKAHSQKVIDQAIAEGHDLNTLTLNLMAADQASVELEKGKKDDVKTPKNDGGDDVPDMKDGKMEHIEHIDAMSKNIANMPGVM